MGNFPHAAGLQVQLLAMHRRGPALQKSHMRQKPSKRRTQELEEKPCAPPTLPIPDEGEMLTRSISTVMKQAMEADSGAEKQQTDASTQPTGPPRRTRRSSRHEIPSP